jgi:hypothetical protein
MRRLHHSAQMNDLSLFDDAKKYLARVVPWPNDGEGASYVNIHWTFQGENYTKPAWTGRACTSVKEAAGAIEWALKQKDTRDVYVCMSSQGETEERTSARGFRYRVPRRSHAHAKLLKSFFIDLDAKGGDNSYESVKDAVVALGAFIKTVGLPKPSMVVSTGGGLHVYWVVARALTVEEWRPIAFALAEATKRHGLKCDTQCTVDAARVLRIPETFNCKLENKRPVRIAGTPTDFDYNVERIEKPLEPYKVAVPTALLYGAGPSYMEDAALFPHRKAVEDVLGAGIEAHKAPPIDLDAVASQCAFVRDAVTLGGKDYTNPLWNITTLISTFTVGGRADAHRMGDKHPGYTKDSTDELYDRKTREKAEKNLGWPSCTGISGAGSNVCQACPHFPAGKSPLNFAVRATNSVGAAPAGPVQQVAQGTAGPALPSAVTQNDLPKGYTRHPSDGIVLEVTKDDDGKLYEWPVLGYAMLDPYIDGDGKLSSLNFATLIRQKPRDISLLLAQINGMGMRELLQEQGVMCPTDEKGMQRLKRFLVAWIKLLQETRDSVNSSEFGWTHESGERTGFVFGGQHWTPNGPVKTTARDSTISRMYKPTGAVQPWTDAYKMVAAQKNQALDVIMASSFAAPLMSMTGHNGMTMSAYSIETGAGKSTAQHVAQAVWGSPKRGISKLDDTYNFAMGKIGRLKSLPLYWDEIKTKEALQQFVKIAFAMTLGVEKGRMARNADLKESGDWQTLLVVCNNDSLLDYVTHNTGMTEAGIVRVFEFPVPKAKAGDPGIIDTTVATRIDAKLNHNYGHAGLKYAEFLGKNHKRIDKEFEALSVAIEKLVKSPQDERLWVATIAVTLLGAKYANELCLTKFDLGAMKKFMIGALDDLRKVRDGSASNMKDDINVSNILAQYWGACRAENILWTDKFSAGTTGKPKKGDIKIQRIPPKGSIAVHVATSPEVMHISVLHLTGWLNRHELQKYVFFKELKDQFGAEKIRASMGAGTDLSGPREYVWEIDMKNKNLNFIV